MTDGRRITSTDVARAAGVSRATVSYVLNDDFRRIPPNTRQKVLDAAEALGYKPSGAARLLRGGKSRLVLMVSPGLESAGDAVAASIITALGDTLAESGFHLVWQLGLSAVGRAASDLAPAVVLVAPTEQEAAFEELRRRFAVPVLPAFPGLDAFLAASATAQVEHLADLGHRRVVYARPAAPELGPSSDIRWTAFRAAAQRLGLEADAVTVPDARPDAAVALERMLGGLDAPTAIGAYNDEVAFLVLAAAHDAGISVPREVSVIGVDDDPIDLLTVPALSSVTADVDEFVAAMAARVTFLAAGGDEPPPPRLPTVARVVARGSTQPPPPR